MKQRLRDKILEAWSTNNVGKLPETNKLVREILELRSRTWRLTLSHDSKDLMQAVDALDEAVKHIQAFDKT